MVVAWIIIAFTILGSTSQWLVTANEQVCSSACSSLGMLTTNPGRSCNDIYQINKASRGVSGNYWIETSTGAHQVYCDMELECDGHKGGWMRIADLDTSRGDECPTEWRKITTPSNPTHPSIDVCQSTTGNVGCFPVIFSTYSANYTKVCGMARGYQRGTTDAFGIAFTTKSINSPYVDGVSITLGNPRKHVWTYAIGISDEGTLGTLHCPCAANPGAPAHAFVGNHYYCESGAIRPPLQFFVYSNDPLWDGNGCVHANNNCCAHPSMPWFFRNFPVPQQEDIEVRLCQDEDNGNEGVSVDQLQLYVL